MLAFMVHRGEAGLSELVIEKVAQYKGVNELDLEKPLYDAINPDALETLFRDGRGEVTFHYLDLLVRVNSERDVEVRSVDWDEPTESVV